VAAVIETRGLSVAFGAVVALDRLDLTLEEGTVGLLGPNGAGKSTLIKCLLGLVTPAAGDLRLLGSPVTGSTGRELRARIGYMPEEECLVPRLNAVEFLRLCARLCGLPDSEAMKRAHESLFLVNLGEARYRDVNDYSTGMKQRLKLAQALVHGPDVLFLDEPTSGLDPTGRGEMLALIRDVARREGLSVILSTHLLGDVEEVCDEVAVLNRGGLVLKGKIEDLRRVVPDRYEVRVKGDAAAFRAAVEREGGTVVEGGETHLWLEVPADTTPDRLLALAGECSAQLRFLKPVTVSLREAFVESLRTPGGEG
jgi:ABC-2 type transport system ATP-binding protein